MRQLLTPLLLLLVFPLAAHACDPPAFDFPRFLHDHDRDQDGFLQKSELLTASADNYRNTLDKPITTEAAFAELDRDRDGKLSLEELWAWGRYTHNTCTSTRTRNGILRSW